MKKTIIEEFVKTLQRYEKTKSISDLRLLVDLHRKMDSELFAELHEHPDYEGREDLASVQEEEEKEALEREKRKQRFLGANSNQQRIKSLRAAKAIIKQLNIK